MIFNKKLMAVAIVFLSGVNAYADTFKHPVTKDVVFDEDSIEFSDFCGYSEVSFNEEDGSLDLVYDDFIAIATGEEVVNKVCQFKIDLDIPKGWKLDIETEAGIGGNHVGKNIASFSHTFGGDVRQAGFKYLIGDGAFTISQELEDIGTSGCGENITLKTVANIIAIGDGDFSLINLNNGALSGTASAWRYHLNWSPCSK